MVAIEEVNSEIHLIETVIFLALAKHGYERPHLEGSWTSAICMWSVDAPTCLVIASGAVWWYVVNRQRKLRCLLMVDGDE